VGDLDQHRRRPGDIGNIILSPNDDREYGAVFTACSRASIDMSMSVIPSGKPFMRNSAPVTDKCR
jgi:hypothetical protein